MSDKTTKNIKIMATVIKTNPSDSEVLEFKFSNSHFIKSDSIILAMSDVLFWLKGSKEISDFIETEGLELCKVDEGEEIYSEEETLIY